MIYPGNYFINNTDAKLQMDNRLNVGIVGSRYYTDYDEFVIKVEEILNEIEIAAIVSGGARGADSLAKRYALENNLKYIEILIYDFFKN